MMNSSRNRGLVQRGLGCDLPPFPGGRPERPSGELAPGPEQPSRPLLLPAASPPPRGPCGGVPGGGMAPAQEAAHPRARPLVTVRGHAESGELASEAGRQSRGCAGTPGSRLPAQPGSRSLRTVLRRSVLQPPNTLRRAASVPRCPPRLAPSCPRLARCREHGRLS